MTTRIIMSSGRVFLLCLLYASIDPSHAAKDPPKGECLPIGEDNRNFHCISSVKALGCIDNNPKCEEWAKRGECKQNGKYMIFHCRKSCQTCIGLHHGGVTQRVNHKEELSKVAERLVRTEKYIYDQTEKHGVSAYSECLNRDASCTVWALNNECDKNPKFMNDQCAAACETCNYSSS